MPPGTYDLTLKFRGHEATGSVEVLGDPHGGADAASWQARWTAIQEIGRLNDAAVAAVERIHATCRDLDAVAERQRAARADELARGDLDASELPLAADAKALREGLEKLEKRIRMPEDTVGIVDDDDSAAAQIGRARYFIQSSWAAPNPTHLAYLRQARTTPRRRARGDRPLLRERGGRVPRAGARGEGRPAARAAASGPPVSGGQRRMRGAGRVVGALCALALTAGAPLAAGEIPFAGLEYLGRAEIPAGTRFGETPVGGLSGLAWDERDGTYVALCDDRSDLAPARLYRLKIDLADGRLDAGDVAVVGKLTLADRRGRPWPSKGLDPEGVAVDHGRLFLSSEGESLVGLAPFVAELAAGWAARSRLATSGALPARPRARSPQQPGVREPRRLAGRAAGSSRPPRTPSSRTARRPTSASPAARGSCAGGWTGGPARPRSSPTGSRACARRRTKRRPSASTAWSTSCRSPTTVWSRSSGSSSTASATRRGSTSCRSPAPPRSRGSTGSRGGADLVFADKRLLVDLGALGVPLDNLEGMTLGPRLPDGRRPLVLISDDNFNEKWQKTQLFAFAVDEAPATIAAIQGPGHRSPLEGHWVFGVDGVVTAVVDRSGQRGFWMESERPDADPATSEGIYVDWEGAGRIAAGARVTVGGRVVEAAANPGQLPVTRLALDSLTERAGRAELPPPAPLFAGPPRPLAIEDDELRRFDPEADALDRWESLEGMRVAVTGATVIGATTGYDALVLLPDGAEELPRTAVGGVRREPAGPPLERVILSGRLAPRLPVLDVGARLEGRIVGIVDYAFSNYQVLATSPLASTPSRRACADRTALIDAAGPPDARHVQRGESLGRRRRAGEADAVRQARPGPGRFDGCAGGGRVAGGPGRLRTGGRPGRDVDEDARGARPGDRRRRRTPSMTPICDRSRATGTEGGSRAATSASRCSPIRCA